MTNESHRIQERLNIDAGWFLAGSADYIEDLGAGQLTALMQSVGDRLYQVPVLSN